MNGRRMTATVEQIPADFYGKMQKGDYLYLPYMDCWYVVAPNGDEGTLIDMHSKKMPGGKHTITEHEDGTITVAPSIQFETGLRWHGYLRRGVWSLD